MSDWIKTKDKLPDHGQLVLVYHPEAVFETKKIRHIKYCGYYEYHKPFVDNFTHWKPAIKPPNDE